MMGVAKAALEEHPKQQTRRANNQQIPVYVRVAAPLSHPCIILFRTQRRLSSGREKSSTNTHPFSLLPLCTPHPLSRQDRAPIILTSWKQTNVECHTFVASFCKDNTLPP